MAYISDSKLEHHVVPRFQLPISWSTPESDRVLQDSIQGFQPPVILDFEGIGQGFTGPNGTFTVGLAPSSSNGAVGPNHFFQIVNTSLAVFDKSGNCLLGPVANNSLWSGFGGGCENFNSGDPTVHYDSIANRWVVTQFSVATQPYLQCVAVSLTGDPTGSYARYSFQYSNYPDYAKLSVWPDAYYYTANMFQNGTTFLGPQVCAFDRNSMLLGLPATQQCFQFSNQTGSLLPADLDGRTLPPTGSPNFIMNYAASSLNIWKFHVDWGTPSNTTLTGPTNITVTPFVPACNGGICIPQLDTTQLLDSLGDRLMYRLAYRNFGDHESVVVNHSVTAGSSAGIRWYEIRSPGSNPFVFQQGTFAPDANYRWMGSIAMDQSQNIAMGYSISSSSMHPGIRFTGRIPTDPIGVMGQGEGTIIDGTGSQQVTLNRWGDYSSIAVDPTDDCTFWYTNQYLADDGTFNWHTRIGTFRLPLCGMPAQDFSLSISPSSQTVAAGNSTSYSTTIQGINGFSNSVSLTVSGLPSGANATFTPNPAISSSTLQISTTTSVAAGTYPLVITGLSGQLSHSINASLTVTAPCVRANPTINISPTSQHRLAGGSLTYNITLINNDSQACSASTFNFSASLPTQFTDILSPGSVTLNPGSMGSGTIQVTSPSNAAPGNYNFVVRATNAANPAFVGSVTGTYVVDPPPVNLAISISPQNATFPRNGNANFTITLTNNNVGVPNNPVMIIVHGPSNWSANTSTNSSGVVNYSFKLNNIPSGLYTITASSTYQGNLVTTSTNFTKQ